MEKLTYQYPKVIEKTFKEWEYLRAQFKECPEMVEYINKTIYELRQIAIPLIIYKKSI